MELFNFVTNQIELHSHLPKVSVRKNKSKILLSEFTT